MQSTAIKHARSVKSRREAARDGRREETEMEGRARGVKEEISSRVERERRRVAREGVGGRVMARRRRVSEEERADQEDCHRHE